MSDFVVEADFSGLEKLIEELDTDYYVDIGILGKDRPEEPGETVASIGAIHENGDPVRGIPQRSFIRMPLQRGAGRLQRRAEIAIPGIEEDGNVRKIFVLLGIEGEAIIKDAFDQGGPGWETLKEETIRRKGSSAILIDKGIMRNSITSEVSS